MAVVLVQKIYEQHTNATIQPHSQALVWEPDQTAAHKSTVYYRGSHGVQQVPTWMNLCAVVRVSLVLVTQLGKRTS